MQFLLAILLLTLSATAHAATSAYQSQLNLIQSGHPSAAYQQLRPKLLASAGNPDFDTAFGLAALDSGAPAEAITALERVLALEPTNLPARTELARAYAQLGDTAAARREIARVQSHASTPAPVRENLSNYASVLDETLRGGPRTLNAELSIGTGFDSNINNATTSSYLIVPALSALGPARVEDGAKAESSLYAETGGTLTVRQPVTPGLTVFASLGANHKATEASGNDQTTLQAETGIQLLTPDHGRLTLGASAQQFWFAGEDYTRTLGLSTNWQYPLTASSNLTTYASANHIEYLSNSAQTANRFVIGTTLDNRWQTTLTPYAFAGAYAGIEETEDNTADYFSHSLAGIQAGLEIFPLPELSLFTDARLEVRSYKADYPLFLNERHDRQLDISTGATYSLTPNWALRPAISYRYADSTIGFYNYTRWLTNLTLRYRFP